MALNDDKDLLPPRSGTNLGRDEVAADPMLDRFDERDTGRSNFAAFLLGGFVISGGLFAFLYYDGDSTNARDGLTTGSIGQIERPIAPMQPAGPAPSIRVPSAN